MLFASYVSKEKREKIIETMVEGIKSVKTSERYRSFLDFCSMFHSYSLTNMLLIWAQRPDATFFAGAGRWNKLRRHIKKGEKGIVIYAHSFQNVVKNDFA